MREKVDRVFLPQGAEKPLLLRYDPSLDPIMRVGFYGPQSLYELRYLAEQEIKRELEALSGVAAVKVKGGLEEEIHVELNERQIAIMGLDIAQINSSLAQNNVNLPGGNLKEGQVEYLIRTLNEFRTHRGNWRTGSLSSGECGRLFARYSTRLSLAQGSRNHHACQWWGEH